MVQEALPTPLFDFSNNDAQAGFRLERLEVYNWGTFDDKVWRLQPNGRNCLLTGEVGSGKSTLVDAVTTLFVPAQKAAFNKAAGAGKKERDLRSYVLGHYKTERSELGPVSAPVPLRDHNSYSVVLGVFFNEGYNQKITLAQVFWCKDTQNQPDRYYVVAKKSLSISHDFANFGSKINLLRKRLRGVDGVEIFDSFPLYSSEFMRQFGIKHRQALELFHQTVSMKSIGNLTDFVRQHMLEAFDIEAEIAALTGHYDDLQRAYDAVRKAKRQIELLSPLVENYRQYKEMEQDNKYMCEYRDALPSYLSSVKAKLLELYLEELEEKTEKLERDLCDKEQEKKRLDGEKDRLNIDIANNGGNRLKELEQEQKLCAKSRDSKQSRADQYRQLVGEVGLSQEESKETFFKNSKLLVEMMEATEQAHSILQKERDEKNVLCQQKKEKHTELSEERESLLKRESNISFKLVQIRENLCRELHIEIDDLPFVGELLQVRQEESRWEGAAERALHNFGLSLIVPDKHYGKVAEYVDKTHLKGRLVYYKVSLDSRLAHSSCSPESLVKKLEIKPDSVYRPWLEHELIERFDYVCCADTDRFRREKQAITIAGQIKIRGRRHEKDDLHHLDDRRRYVLGWSNRQKIATFTADLEVLEKDIYDLLERIVQKNKELEGVDKKKNALSSLQIFSNYDEQDWQADVKQLDELQREIDSIKQADDKLATLKERLEKVQKELDTAGQVEREMAVEKGRLEELHKQNNAALKECLVTIGRIEEEKRGELFDQLEAIQGKIVGGQALTLDSCQDAGQKLYSYFKQEIESFELKLKKRAEDIIRAMHNYCTEFAIETQEVTRSLDDGPEYAKMLDVLEKDNLPRYERNFKESLNQNTIREVVQFHANLDKQNRLIVERIEQINKSLAGIEFNPGTYIKLEASKSVDKEIREFQQQLRICGGGSIGDSEEEQYAEKKFNEVKMLIDRFRGREEAWDIDKQWVKKVTDVRNWFHFAASELYQEDDSEYEHYTDTGGKSGGQKEKLAYTVLAASLVYQFGLEKDAIKSRSFRFVTIDEAFGRGSDESTRYALNLFKELNLQLLIVTPLQKIHTIEPFVSSVGFVHNEGGMKSQLRCLTIQEFRVERDRREGLNNG